jgi:hypothetical protein
VQGLIQVAAACVHLRHLRAAPAARLLALAVAKLADAPDELGGVPAAALRETARDVLSDLERGSMPPDWERLFRPPAPRGTG